MTERVDFYVLKSSTAKQRWTFACRLTEKAYLRDLKVVQGDCAMLVEISGTFILGSGESLVRYRHLVCGVASGNVVASNGHQQLALLHAVAELGFDRDHAARG